LAITSTAGLVIAYSYLLISTEPEGAFEEVWGMRARTVEAQSVEPPPRCPGEDGLRGEQATGRARHCADRSPDVPHARIGSRSRGL